MSWSPASRAGLQAGERFTDVSERAIRDLRALIDLAARDSATSSRIALADTTVSIELSDRPGQAFTLYVDREPVELGGNDDAEIAVVMTSLQLEMLTRGELALAMEIAHGRIAYSGPVRKFLRIVPILRRVSREWMADPGRDSDGSLEAAFGVPGRS